MGGCCDRVGVSYRVTGQGPLSNPVTPCRRPCQCPDSRHKSSESRLETRPGASRRNPLQPRKMGRWNRSAGAAYVPASLVRLVRSAWHAQGVQPSACFASAPLSGLAMLTSYRCLRLACCCCYSEMTTDQADDGMQCTQTPPPTNDANRTKSQGHLPVILELTCVVGRGMAAPTPPADEDGMQSSAAGNSTVAPAKLRGTCTYLFAGRTNQPTSGRLGAASTNRSAITTARPAHSEPHCAST